MLDKLPREIWSCILQYHCSVGTLWACGNRALHLRLSSAVESVTLIHIPVGEFVIPSWVMELSNLKHFELRSLGNCASGQRRWSAMSKLLPNTLESLTIDAQDSCTSFAQWITTVDDLSPDCYPLTSAFPKLTSLALKHAAFGMPSDFLLFLPSTLTSLEVGPTIRSDPFFSKLPRSLTYLAANPFIGYPKKSMIVQAHLDDITQAPPGMVLTQMTLYTLAEETVHLLSKLPFNLLELTASRYLPSMVPLLPRSLVKLDLGVDQRFLYSTLDPNMGEVSTASLSMDWPPTLQELIVTFTSSAQGVLASLPRTLLRLSMLFAIDGTGLCIPFHSNELPPHLRELTISITRFHKLDFDDKLPHTLTHLSMLGPVMNPPNLSASLPDSIESLTLTIHEYGIRARKTSGITFPPNLRALNVSRWRSEWMSEIPPQVTNLQIETLDNTFAKYDLFSSLPRGLTSFKSKKLASNIPLVASFERDLLPSLLHLTLPMTLKLTPASIKRLPRTLKTLVITVDELSSWKGDVKFLVDLPPHLEKCKVFPRDYKSNDIEEYWPPALWRCLLADEDKWSKIPRLRERLAMGPPPPSSNWLTSIVDSIFK